MPTSEDPPAPPPPEAPRRTPPWTGAEMPRERVPFRALWVYAVDPTLAYELNTAAIHRQSLKLRRENEDLRPGPVGEYLEVIDHDPASRCFYPGVDLGSTEILLNGGLSPSEGDPRFHQQMVYAVAMTTIETFERILGRRSMWARRRGPAAEADRDHGYVKRLRVYPHALREANAYYDPEKKALLFGYFPAAGAASGLAQTGGGTMPGGTVFTCLSFDIVAHETTHALLDGLHPHFLEPSNVDVLAFHEAFADIVALFQHFGMQDLLAHQIAKTRGDLGSQSLLAQLAQQFGRATGRHGALRDALGEADPDTGVWRPYVPTGLELQGETEPHARGAVLVAAVFDAFLNIYRLRTADLVRLASGGTGVLREGALHPDLVNRLAKEATKSATHVLGMCVRALDSLPPVDVTFGDYIQALVTADYDLVPDDRLGYRVAFVEAFRRRGIYPRHVRTLSEASLRWSPPPDRLAGLDRLRRNAAAPDERLTLREIVAREPSNRKRGAIDWNARGLVARIKRVLEAQMEDAPDNAERRLAVAAMLGIDPAAPFEVDVPRPSYREGPGGESLKELAFDVLQAVYLPLDAPCPTGGDPVPRERAAEPPPPGSFVFRGGSTVILDLDANRIRYCVSKNVLSPVRRELQRRFLAGGSGSLQALYFGGDAAQPFARLHRARGEA